MKDPRKNSPWAFGDDDLKCPRCSSTKIHRVLDRYMLARGIQMFECASCGRKFYDRGVDDYKPTFER